MAQVDSVRRLHQTLLVAILVLLAWALVAPGITTRGEAREALVVRDVLTRGDWIIAYRDGALASKPPLYHWIAAGAASVAGLHDPVVRVPSALAALAMLALTAMLGRRMGGPMVGALAAAVLAANPYFWISATEARVDMLFAMLVTAALAAFWVWYREADERARRLCWVAIAAAVLTKGPAGAVLPALAIVLFLAWQRRLSELRALASGWPVGLAVAVVVGWYVAAYRTAGADFLHVQILHENVQRMLGGGDFAQSLHRRLKLPGAFASHLFPWNLVLVWSVWRWLHGAPTTPTDRFLHAWWIALVAFFAIAARTRGVYLLPAHPAVALLAAQALAPYATPVLRTTIAAAAVAVLAAVQFGRLSTADAEPLRVFAERIQARVGAAPVLRAAAALPENDALVLRWRLDRSIRRGRLRCDPRMPTLAPRAALERAESLGLQATEVADTPAGGIALLECSRARVVHR